MKLRPLAASTRTYGADDLSGAGAARIKARIVRQFDYNRLFRGQA